MEATVAKRKVTIRTVTSSARAATDLPGFVEILKGRDVILTVWSWEVQALFAEDDGTTVVMKAKEPWHVTVDVPLAEARGALVTAQALWEAHRKTENLAQLKARGLAI